MKKCPFCAEEIQEEAKKCRFCGEWLDEKPESVEEDVVVTKEEIKEKKKEKVKTKEKIEEEIQNKKEEKKWWQSWWGALIIFVVFLFVLIILKSGSGIGYYILLTPLQFIQDPVRTINQNLFGVVIWIVILIWFIHRARLKNKQKKQSLNEKSNN